MEIFTTGGTGVHRVPQGNSTTYIPRALVCPDSASFRLRTRVVNTTNDETLADFYRGRLECFKHFSNFLFETECVEHATTVHIQRRDRPDRNLRPSAAMVGRTGHRRAWPSGPPPH